MTDDTDDMELHDALRTPRRRDESYTDHATRLLAAERIAALHAELSRVLLILDEAPHEALYNLQFVMFKDGKTYAVPPDGVRGFAKYVREKSKALAQSGWAAQKSMQRAHGERDLAVGRLSDIVSNMKRLHHALRIEDGREGEYVRKRIAEIVPEVLADDQS